MIADHLFVTADDQMAAVMAGRGQADPTPPPAPITPLRFATRNKLHYFPGLLVQLAQDYETKGDPHILKQILEALDDELTNVHHCQVVINVSNTGTIPVPHIKPLTPPAKVGVNGRSEVVIPLEDGTTIQCVINVEDKRNPVSAAVVSMDMPIIHKDHELEMQQIEVPREPPALPQDYTELDPSKTEAAKERWIGLIDKPIVHEASQRLQEHVDRSIANGDQVVPQQDADGMCGRDSEAGATECPPESSTKNSRSRSGSATTRKTSTKPSRKGTRQSSSTSRVKSTTKKSGAKKVTAGKGKARKIPLDGTVD